MATSSLKAQLDNLRLSQKTFQRSQNNMMEAPSMMFSKDVASGVDLDSIYAISLQGLRQLILAEPYFAIYQDRLFSQAQFKMDRSLLRQDENKELGKIIKDFICLLSQYFLYEECHKVLDYLLRNFQVHRYETDDLIICFMHFHSTSYYTRLIQNVDLKASKHFYFAQPIIAKGDLLSREVIIKQISGDQWIIQQLVKYNKQLRSLMVKQQKDIVINVEQVTEDNSSSLAKKKDYQKASPLNFLAAVATEVLQKNQKESYVQFLIETITVFIGKSQFLSFMFSLNLLGSIIGCNVQLNTVVIGNLLGYIVVACDNKFNGYSKKQQQVANEAIVKLIALVFQRNLIVTPSDEATDEQKDLNKKLKKFLSKNIDQLKKLAPKFSMANMLLHFFKLSVVTGCKSKSDFELIGNLAELVTTHDLFFREVQDVRDCLVRELCEQTLDSGSEEHILFLKQYFLPNFIAFLAFKISQSKESVGQVAGHKHQQKIEKAQKKALALAEAHFPSLFALAGGDNKSTTLVLDSNSFLLFPGFSGSVNSTNNNSDHSLKKSQQSNREYLSGLLKVLQSQEKDREGIAEFLPYITNVSLYLLRTETNKKNINLILEILASDLLLESEAQAVSTHLKQYLLCNNLNNATPVQKTLINQLIQQLVKHSQNNNNERDIISIYLAVVAAAVQESETFMETQKVILSHILQTKRRPSEDLSIIKNYNEKGSLLKMYVKSKQMLSNFLIKVRISLKDHNRNQAVISGCCQTVLSAICLLLEEEEKCEGLVSCHESIVSLFNDLSILPQDLQECVKPLYIQVTNKLSQLKANAPLLFPYILTFMLASEDISLLETLKLSFFDLNIEQDNIQILLNSIVFNTFYNRLLAKSSILMSNVKAIYIINQFVKKDKSLAQKSSFIAVLTVLLVLNEAGTVQEKEALFTLLDNVKKHTKQDKQIKLDFCNFFTCEGAGQSLGVAQLQAQQQVIMEENMEEKYNELSLPNINTIDSKHVILLIEMLLKSKLNLMTANAQLKQMFKMYIKDKDIFIAILEALTTVASKLQVNQLVNYVGPIWRLIAEFMSCSTTLSDQVCRVLPIFQQSSLGPLKYDYELFQIYLTIAFRLGPKAQFNQHFEDFLLRPCQQFFAIHRVVSTDKDIGKNKILQQESNTISSLLVQFLLRSTCFEEVMSSKTQELTLDFFVQNERHFDLASIVSAFSEIKFSQELSDYTLQRVEDILIKLFGSNEGQQEPQLQQMEVEDKGTKHQSKKKSVLKQQQQDPHVRRELQLLLEVLLVQSQSTFNYKRIIRVVQLLHNEQQLSHQPSYEALLALKILKLTLVEQLKYHKVNAKEFKVNNILGNYNGKANIHEYVAMIYRFLEVKDDAAASFLEQPVHFGVVKTAIEILNLFATLKFKEVSNYIYIFLSTLAGAVDKMQEDKKIVHLDQIFTNTVSDLIAQNSSKKNIFVKFQLLHCRLLFQALKLVNEHHQSNPASIQNNKRIMVGNQILSSELPAKLFKSLLKVYGPGVLYIVLLSAAHEAQILNLQQPQQEIGKQEKKKGSKQAPIDGETQSQLFLDSFLQVLMNELRNYQQNGCKELLLCLSKVYTYQKYLYCELLQRKEKISLKQKSKKTGRKETVHKKNKLFETLTKQMIVPNNNKHQRRSLSYTLLLISRILQSEEFSKMLEKLLVSIQMNNTSSEKESLNLQPLSDFYLKGIDFALLVKQQLNRQKSRVGKINIEKGKGVSEVSSNEGKEAQQFEDEEVKDGEDEEKDQQQMLKENKVAPTVVDKQQKMITKFLKKLYKAVTQVNETFSRLLPLEAFIQVISAIMKQVQLQQQSGGVEEGIALFSTTSVGGGGDNYLLKIQILSVLSQKLEINNIKKGSTGAALREVVAFLKQELLKNKIQLISQSEPKMQRYLQSSLHALTLIAHQSPRVFVGAINQGEGSDTSSSSSLNELTEVLIDLLNIEQQAVKTSLLFLISLIAPQCKTVVLENLNLIFQEIFKLFLALIYYSTQSSNEGEEERLTNTYQRVIKTTLQVLPQAQPPSSLQDEGDNEGVIVRKSISQMNRQLLKLDPQAAIDAFAKQREVLVRNEKNIFSLLMQVLTSLTSTLKNLISPLIPGIVTVVYAYESRNSPSNSAFFDEQVKQYISKLIASVETRVLVEKFLGLFDHIIAVSPTAVQRFSNCLAAIFSSMQPADVDVYLAEIVKKFVRFLDYTRIEFVNSEKLSQEHILVEQVENAQITALSQIILKTNENQLRKYFQSIVTWSEKKLEESACGYLFRHYRKIMLAKLAVALCGVMKSLFVPFYTFFFESLLHSLTEFGDLHKDREDQEEEDTTNQATSNKGKMIGNKHVNNKKRKLDQDSQLNLLQLQLCQLNLKALQNCFDNDENLFIDTIKFDQLINPLTCLYEAYGVNEFFSYSQFIEQSLVPCVVSLFKLIKDDFKLKTFNYNLLLKSKSDRSSVKVAVLYTIDSLIDALDQKYIVFVNDIFPFLAETLGDINPEVDKLSKQIVVKLENLSGENIREYFNMKV